MKLPHESDIEIILESLEQPNNERRKLKVEKEASLGTGISWLSSPSQHFPMASGFLKHELECCGPYATFYVSVLTFIFPGREPIALHHIFKGICDAPSSTSPN